MDSPLLSSFERKALKEFNKDLVQMLRVAKNIDKYYARSDSNLDLYLDKYASLIDTFNKKYKGIKLKVSKKTDEVNLRLFLNEKNIHDCFANSASKIIGLQSIGSSKFGAVGVSDTASFTNEIEKAKDKLYITYYNPETGNVNVFLHYDKKEKKIELVYEQEEIVNEPSPEFQLAAFYALSQGYDKKIDMQGSGSKFGFSYVPHHTEKAEYFRKFDPHISE
ncbi:MAG: hypothetical protein AABX34_00335 [Nanoarchaeota archaeon]